MNQSFIIVSIIVFLVIILLLVVVLLIAKKFLSPSGNVKININGEKELSVEQGNSVMNTLNENGIFLLRVEVKLVVDNVSFKLLRVEERFSILNVLISHVKKLKIIGA